METFLNNGAYAAWMQALIYLITLVVLFWQFRLLRVQTQIQTNALNEQIKNTKYAEYSRCKADFLQSMRQLISDNLHGDIYNSLYKAGSSKFNVDWEKYTVEDKRVYAYFEILYELFVRVYLIRKESVITADEWTYWEVWLNDVIRHPIFKDVHLDALGMYDRSFQQEITDKLDLIIKNKSK